MVLGGIAEAEQDLGASRADQAGELGLATVLLARDVEQGGGAASGVEQHGRVGHRADARSDER